MQFFELTLIESDDTLDFTVGASSYVITDEELVYESVLSFIKPELDFVSEIHRSLEEFLISKLHACLRAYRNSISNRNLNSFTKGRLKVLSCTYV